MAADTETRKGPGRPPRQPAMPAADSNNHEDATGQEGLDALGEQEAATIAPVGYEVDLADDYEKPQGQQSLGVHPDLRVIVGSDRDEDMDYMAGVAQCKQVRPGAMYHGRPVIGHEELCQRRVQSDGQTYLWKDSGPLWMETWAHWEAREKARDRERALKFQHNLEQVEQAIQSQFPMQQ